MQHAGTRWVLIQRNPTSGTGKKRGELLSLVRRLKQHGFRPRLFGSRHRLDRFLSDPDRRAATVCVVAAGGDGTVGDVVNRCHGLPVAILALGTENLIARHLKLPADGAALADVIAAGNKRRLDAWTLNGRRFLIMAGFGFDAEIVRRTAERRSGNISKLTYAAPLWESLRDYAHPELRVFIDDGDRAEVAGLMIAVSLPAYALGLQIAGSAEGDDGVLDLRLFERRSAFQMVRYFYKVMQGEHEALPDVQSVRARRFRVESDEPIPIQIDGDFAGFTPATVELLPGGWEVYVPPSTR